MISQAENNSSISLWPGHFGGMTQVIAFIKHAPLAEEVEAVFAIAL